jgi:NAD+ synthetase
MPPSLNFATLQFSPEKGAYSANLARLGALFAQIDAADPRVDLLHLPETALTGYFLEGGVREMALTAGALAADLQRAYREAVKAPRTLEVIVGFYEIWRNTLYNSAMSVRLGGEAPLVRHVHRKNFLPTYGLFDEERFVERGQEIRAFDLPWGRAAMLVCEDAWHSVTGTLAALDGAQLIFICAAAPARGTAPRDDGIPGPASVARWERLARDIAEEHGVFVSLANLVGDEGGKAFPGGAIICGPGGDVRIRGPLWEEALVSAPMDLADLTRARTDMPLLADLRVALPHLLTSLDRIQRGGGAPVAFDGAPPAAASAPAAKGAAGKKPAVAVRVAAAEAGGPPPLTIDAALVERWLVQFLRDEAKQRGFTKGIVALSGGVDSAVTAALAARAFGPKNVTGVRLPYEKSSKDSLTHAKDVIDALGIESRTIDISPAVNGYLQNEPKADATRRGNVMARVRMLALFDLSAALGAMPLGTGNKTERLLGYFTWHADDSPPLNPLGDLFKTQVWALAKHLKIPADIVGKAPTADLVAGQTDEEDLGISYAKADLILHWLLSGFSPEELVARGFVAKEVKLVHDRLERTHWKRRLPTVAIVSGTAIGESYLRPVDY